ncbi:MAG: hypothetical protein IKT59_00325 [Bacteroidales bacterium]|nr:hypothetical protein [Bacteroidales bacterium]
MMKTGASNVQHWSGHQLSSVENTKNREYYFECIKSEITHIFKADQTDVYENIPSEAWRESSEKGRGNVP